MASHQSTLICEVGSVGVHVILKPRVGTSSSPPRSSRLSSSALAVWHLHKEPSHCLGVHVLSHLVRVRVRDRLRVRVTVTVTVTVTVRVRVRLRLRLRVRLRVRVRLRLRLRVIDERSLGQG